MTWGKKEIQAAISSFFVDVVVVVVVVVAPRVTNPSLGNEEVKRVRQVNSVCQFVLSGLRRMRREFKWEDGK